MQENVPVGQLMYSCKSGVNQALVESPPPVKSSKGDRIEVEKVDGGGHVFTLALKDQGLRLDIATLLGAEYEPLYVRNILYDPLAVRLVARNKDERRHPHHLIWLIDLKIILA